MPTKSKLIASYEVSGPKMDKPNSPGTWYWHVTGSICRVILRRKTDLFFEAGSWSEHEHPVDNSCVGNRGPQWQKVYPVIELSPVGKRGLRKAAA